MLRLLRAAAAVVLRCVAALPAARCGCCVAVLRCAACCRYGAAAAGAVAAHAAAGEENLTSTLAGEETFNISILVFSTFIFYNFNILKAKC